MKMTQHKFYKCYSINLHRFIKANGVKPLSKGVNERTGKTYWFYRLEEVKYLLIIWSQNKKEEKE